MIVLTWLLLMRWAKTKVMNRQHGHGRFQNAGSSPHLGSIRRRHDHVTDPGMKTPRESMIKGSSVMVAHQRRLHPDCCVLAGYEE